MATLTTPTEPSSPQSPEVRRLLLSVVVVAGLAELAYSVMNISAMPVYLMFGLNYGASLVAAIGTAFLIAEALTKSPLGALGDRIGRKWLIVGGPVISVFTALLTLVVRAPISFVVLRVLDGLGAAALWPSALALISDVTPPERRSQAMSMFNVTYLIGVAFGPQIGGLVDDAARYLMQTRGIDLPLKSPYEASFYLVSLLFAITALTALIRIPDIRIHHRREDGELAAHPTVKEMLASIRRIPETLAIAFVTFFGIGLIMLIIKIFAMQQFNISERGFGALLLPPALLIAFASIKLGTLGDKIGNIKALRLGLGLCTASMWAILLLRTVWSLIIVGSLIGIGFVIAFPAWMAYITTNCDSRHRGAVVGAVGTAQGVGALLGAPLGGVLYQYVGLHIGRITISNHYMPFVACTLCLGIAWLLSIFTVRDKPQRMI